MASVTLKGNPFQTIGNLPAIGSKMADFSLIAGDLSKKTLNDFSGSRILFNKMRMK